MGQRPGLGLNLWKGDVIPNLPTLGEPPPFRTERSSVSALTELLVMPPESESEGGRARAIRGVHVC